MIDRDLTVYLVDDDAAVRDSLSLMIESEGYAVKAFATAHAFLDECGMEPLGCAVIDLRMPSMSGVQLQKEMARRGFLLPIIFLTAHGDIPTSVRAIKAGAVDFLIKPVAGADLLKSIAAALAVAEKRSAEAKESADATLLIARLTEREDAVLKLIVKGLSNKDIASQLGISHRTVEIHKAHVMKKTGAATLVELMHIVQLAGIN